MKHQWAIGPSIGVARVGNCPDEFYVEPERVGALPIYCTLDGNVGWIGPGQYRRVENFKDDQDRIKRQAARFRVFKFDGERWLLPEDGEIEEIKWTVHLANKKACWYNFAELRGNLLFPDNAYNAPHDPIPHRNHHVPRQSRRTLIIDPGPRTLSLPGDCIRFDAATANGYAHANFQKPVVHGDQITSLGEMRLNDAGELLVLGGFGRAGGVDSIQSFAGADTWHDDISDGPVTCTLTVGGETIELRAWCIVGSPRFAPEIVNIVTLADTMEDVAVRHLGYRPGLYDVRTHRFDASYVADFERDIRPILERPAAYRWVANIPALMSVSPPPFDPRDATAATSALRQAYFKLFRAANPEHAIDPTHNHFEVPATGPVPGFPLMPLNSGSNSVGNQPNLIDKFLSLTQTQHFILGQWARGQFKVGPPVQYREDPESLTLASMGNCVGAPLCPGIEVTWNTRNPQIYDGPFSIRHRHPESTYAAQGLDPEHDETDPAALAGGCEPGDLTKRMAIPWQADFFQCSAQFINFSSATVNQAGGIPKAPSYYAYWWPPQSPWHVITGDTTDQEQALAGTPAGYQVLFARGINSFAQMISSWYYMGFILNQSRGALREQFPYFTERDRHHEGFMAASYALGDAGDVLGGDNGNFSNAWILLPPPNGRVPTPVAFPTSRRHGRIPHGQG